MGSTNSKPSVSTSPSTTTTLSRNDDDDDPTTTMTRRSDESSPTTTPPSSSSSSLVDEPKKTNGCPMHNSDGSYSFDWWKVISGEYFSQHGPTGPTPLSNEEAESKVGVQSTASSNNTTTTATSINNSSSSSSSSTDCPVKHNSASSSIPLAASLSANISSSGGGGCPVKHQSSSSSSSTSSSKAKPEYNVYGQLIDPTNNMPYNPNQLPSYDQNISLSTHRVASTIPKGGGGDDDDDDNRPAVATTATWLYPSPQMFYNALQRKNKLYDESNSNSSSEAMQHEQPLLQAQDIESVVAIHNNMNEKTWYKILQWESIVHQKPIDEIEPKLLKFQGRPMDLSPKAAIKYYLFGHPLPYDRHDWIVERNYNKKNGTIQQQRYIIDYYYDSSLGRNDPDSAIPDLHDRTTGSPSLLVDVRPALDTPMAFYHRIITMPYAQYIQQQHQKGSTTTTATKKDSTTTTTSETDNDLRQEKYEYLPLWPSPTMKSQVNESIKVWQDIRKQSYPASPEQIKEDEEKISKRKQQLQVTVQDELIHQFQDAVQNCQKEQIRMNQACSNVTTDTDDNDDDNNNNKCAKASIDLTLCMGKILCPIQHNAFKQTIRQQSNNTNNDIDDTIMIDDALTRLQDCLKYKSQQYQQLNKRN